MLHDSSRRNDLRDHKGSPVFAKDNLAISKLMELSEFYPEAIFLHYSSKQTCQVIKAFEHDKLHNIQANDQATDLLLLVSHKLHGFTIGML